MASEDVTQEAAYILEEYWSSMSHQNAKSYRQVIIAIRFTLRDYLLQYLIWNHKLCRNFSPKWLDSPFL